MHVVVEAHLEVGIPLARDGGGNLRCEQDVRDPHVLCDRFRGAQGTAHARQARGDLDRDGTVVVGGAQGGDGIRLEAEGRSGIVAVGRVLDGLGFGAEDGQMRDDVRGDDAIGELEFEDEAVLVVKGHLADRTERQRRGAQRAHVRLGQDESVRGHQLVDGEGELEFGRFRQILRGFEGQRAGIRPGPRARDRGLDGAWDLLGFHRAGDAARGDVDIEAPRDFRAARDDRVVAWRRTARRSARRAARLNQLVIADPVRRLRMAKQRTVIQNRRLPADADPEGAGMMASPSAF